MLNLLLIATAPLALPPLVVPDGLGVNLGFDAYQGSEVQRMLDSGFRIVRRDLFWHDVETKKGVYDFKRYDQLLQEFKSKGLVPIFILCYGNDLYEKGAPKTPQAQAAFTNFVLAALKHYQGDTIWWEMWNEPNGIYWQPGANADQYADLFLKVGKEARRAGYEVPFLGPALAGIDLPFLERCFQRGLHRYWSAVTVHPYRPMEPETVVRDYGRVRALMERYNARRPILGAEWGYSAAANGLGEERQADFFVRTYLTNLYADVPVTVWYNWRNNGTDPHETEHHFGVYGRNLEDKPVTRSLRKMLQELSGARFAGRLASRNAEDWFLLFKKHDKAKVVAWRSDQSQRKVRAPWGAIVALSGRPSYHSVDLSKWPRTGRGVPLPGALSLSGPDDLRRTLQSYPQQTRVSGAAAGSTWSASVPLTSLDRLSRFTDQSENLHRLRIDAPNALPTEVSAVHSNPLFITLLPSQGNQIEVELSSLRSVVVGRIHVSSGTQNRIIAVRITPQKRRVRVPGIPSDQPMKIRLLDEEGRVRWSAGPITQQRISWQGQQFIIEGKPDVPGNATLYETRLPSATPTGEQSGYQINFQFGNGWRYAMLRASTLPSLPGVPDRYVAWVYGDASGALLLARIEDTSGQTFQPEGIVIDWKGWRLVSFPLDGSTGGRWGGANDGRIRYPVKLSASLVIDNPGGKGVAGTIFVSNPTIFTQQNTP